jgi:hypothetical protein
MLAVGGDLGFDQRAATYSVISKPKRMSVAAGVCQTMNSLLVPVARPPGGERGDRNPGLQVRRGARIGTAPAT